MPQRNPPQSAARTPLLDEDVEREGNFTGHAGIVAQDKRIPISIVLIAIKVRNINTIWRDLQS
jgi:hypothetical protein